MSSAGNLHGHTLSKYITGEEGVHGLMKGLIVTMCMKVSSHSLSPNQSLSVQPVGKLGTLRRCKDYFHILDFFKKILTVIFIALFKTFTHSTRSC